MPNHLHLIWQIENGYKADKIQFHETGIDEFGLLNNYKSKFFTCLWLGFVVGHKIKQRLGMVRPTMVGSLYKWRAGKIFLSNLK